MLFFSKQFETIILRIRDSIKNKIIFHVFFFKFRNVFVNMCINYKANYNYSPNIRLNINYYTYFGSHNLETIFENRIQTVYQTHIH